MFLVVQRTTGIHRKVRGNDFLLEALIRCEYVYFVACVPVRTLSGAVWDEVDACLSHLHVGI